MLKDAQYNNFYIFLISIVAALGGLLFGFDWVIIGGAKPFYEAFFHITSEMQRGWVMSAALLGCMMGALVAGTMSDYLGRKNTLILTSVLFIISALGTALSHLLGIFVFFRIMTGFAIGMASTVAPIYIAEVSPQETRGRMVAINQLAIVIGVLIAQIVNFLIAMPVSTQLSAQAFWHTWNVQTGWRYMFGSGILPAILFFGTIFFIPKSPRWLAKIGKEYKARRVLTRIGGKSFAELSVKNIINSLKKNKKVGFREFFSPKFRKVMLLGVILAVFQQWCGINVIFTYAQEVFSQAGYSINAMLMNIVIVGSVNLIFTVVSMFLVDKVGRRQLLLLGASLLSIIYALLGACYFFHIQGMRVLILVILGIATYAATLAPIVWVVLSEIFPNAIRGKAMAIATLMLWMGSFTLTLSFPILNLRLGADGTFWLYSLICLAGFIFLYCRLPETKMRSLEELEKIFQPAIRNKKNAVKNKSQKKVTTI